MGLFTAYYCARDGARVAIIDESYIGNPATASFGLTRSYRNDYLDERYSLLATSAADLWRQFEVDSDTSVLVPCGCLNLTKASITPDYESTYAVQTSKILSTLGLGCDVLIGQSLVDRFPQFRADDGYLVIDAGMVDVTSVTSALLKSLRKSGVRILERTQVLRVTADETTTAIVTPQATLRARNVVVTAGHGTNAVLAAVEGCDLRIPTTKDRPSEAKYYLPPPESAARYMPDAFPVFAYLDIGIYGHPWYPGVTPGVKIGYYNPPDLQRTESSIDSVGKFVAECMPELLDAQVSDVTGVDQCFYDLVADDEFVVGRLPGASNIIVGTGWRGTGYKFAPWVGRTLSDLVTGVEDQDLTRFDPARFSAVPA